MHGSNQYVHYELVGKFNINEYHAFFCPKFLNTKKNVLLFYFKSSTDLNLFIPNEKLTYQRLAII